MMKLNGIMTALVTPLNADGSVNEAKLIELIDYQIDHKVHSLLILGGTGEYTSMTIEDRHKTIDITVKAVNKRVPVIAGVLETGLGECKKFCEYCKDAGADAMLVLTPFYIAGTQDALVEFYKALDQVNIPILVYNIPYRTNVNILPDTVLRLTKEMKNLVGIKECAALGQATELLLKVGGKINVLTGDEFSAVSLMTMGFDGAIMATANVVPDAWVAMYDLVQAGKIQDAAAMSLKYYPLFKAIFSENYISPLKYAMEKAGVPSGLDVLLPLLPTSAAGIEKVDAEMAKLGL